MKNDDSGQDSNSLTQHQTHKRTLELVSCGYIMYVSNVN